MIQWSKHEHRLGHERDADIAADLGCTVEAVALARSKRGIPALPRRVTPLAVRFARHVDRAGGEDACHLWTGSFTGPGYGQIAASRGRPVLAHRVAYELAHGAIPDGDGHHGTVVMHTCDNRACVNPKHLRLGSQAENLRDMRDKGRHRQGVRVLTSKETDHGNRIGE